MPVTVTVGQIKPEDTVVIKKVDAENLYIEKDNTGEYNVTLGSVSIFTTKELFELFKQVYKFTSTNTIGE